MRRDCLSSRGLSTGPLDNGQSACVDLHDATLDRLDCDWPGRRAELSFKLGDSTNIRLAVTGLRSLAAERMEPWGASASVLEVVGPTSNDDNSARIILKMQSGDEIVIVAEHIAFRE